LRNHDACK
jgi:hypothetical protein